MLENLKIEKVLFLDIETVPCEYNFEDLDNTFQKLWEEKTKWRTSWSNERNNERIQKFLKKLY